MTHLTKLKFSHVVYDALESHFLFFWLTINAKRDNKLGSKKNFFYLFEHTHSKQFVKKWCLNKQASNFFVLLLIIAYLVLLWRFIHTTRLSNRKMIHVLSTRNCKMHITHCWSEIQQQQRFLYTLLCTIFLGKTFSFLTWLFARFSFSSNIRRRKNTKRF